MEQQGSISEFESDSSAKPSSSSYSPSLEDILKLLRGQTDSQRMAGLFLVTKFCNTGDPQHTILEIYRALDPTFLRRLLLTGMGKGTAAAGCDDANRDTYLRLSVTVLSAFARASQIASTKQMLAKVPLFLEILSERYVVHYFFSTGFSFPLLILFCLVHWHKRCDVCNHLSNI